MKKTILTIILILTSIIIFAQKSELEDIKIKYESYYKASNIKMGILLKRDSTYFKVRLNFPKNNENNVFNIASATKTFTAVLVLQEIEKGNLKLTDSIGKYLSPIDNVSSNITIEQLLRHQTGLAEVVGDQKWDVYNIPQDSLLRRDVFRNVPTRNIDKIGKFEYANINYILLGEILEKINDKSYFDLLEEQIFEPCKMENTYPYISKNIPRLIHPTDEKNEKDRYNGINYKFFANYCFSAGSIASTLDDMAKFYENLFEKEILINKNSLKKMTDFKEGNYGLGLQKFNIDEIEFYGHGGNNYGYSFRIYYNPKNGNMILYFTNRFRVPFKNSLLEDLSAVMNKKLIREFRKNITNEFKHFKGTYILEGPNLEFSIFERDNLLYFQVKNLKVPLVSYEPNILSDVTSGINFTKSKDKPNQIIWNQNGQKIIANKTNRN